MCDFQANRGAPLTLRQFVFECLGEVLGLFFVHEEVRVAGDAKLVAAAGFHAWKQVVNVSVDYARQEDKIIRACAANVRWNLDQSWQCTRRLHNGKPGIAAKGILAGQGNHEIERFIEYSRKRMGGVKPDGRQDREQLGCEVLAQPFVLLGGPFRATQKANFFLLQSGHHNLVEDPILFLHKSMSLCRDGGEYLVGQHSIRATLRRRGLRHLFESRHANFEKLIQVGAGNAQEFEAFQNGNGVVFGLIEYPPVELEQRQLPVDIQIGCLKLDFCGCVHVNSESAVHARK